MTEYATQAQVDWMKQAMLDHNLFTDHYDRLWKILAAHEIDVRTHGDGTRMPLDMADRTVAWLQRQIEKLTPAVTQPRREDSPDIPAGYYATPSRTGSNDLDFWRVDRPDSGHWAGYTFVKRVIGGHSDTRVRGREKWDALRAISAVGVEAAALKYAAELGRCSNCNRHLTDELSRQRGKGPECWSKSAA